MSRRQSIFLVVISIISFATSFRLAEEGMYFLKERSERQGDDYEVLISPNSIPVRSPGTFNIYYVLKAAQSKANAHIKLRFPKGFYYLQKTNPSVQAYVTASTSKPGVTATVTDVTTREFNLPWDWDVNGWIITVSIDKPLSTGDTVKVTVGANAPAGAVYSSHSAYKDSVVSAYDLEAKFEYIECKSKPFIHIKELTFQDLNAVQPSIAKPGDTVSLRIAATDIYKNLVTNFSGVMFLSATDASATLPSEIIFAPGDSGKKDIKVVYNTEGVHYINYTIKESGTSYSLNGNTNPIKVTGNITKRLYWGDLHSHSRASHDGFGTQNFYYASQVSYLDFYGMTDHTSGEGGPEHGGLNFEEWDYLKRVLKSYHKPGRFVTIPAYEYSQILPSGHHNIYFNVPDDSLDQIPLFRDDIMTHIQQVWRVMKDGKFSDIDYVTIPHHTGLIFNKDNKYPPLVHFGKGYSNTKTRKTIEIYSEHGLSESYAPKHGLSYTNMKKSKILSTGPHYAHDAWALDEHLGVIASSDDHSGRPGLNFKGIAAIYADSLTRKEIFKGLKDKYSYGTTGERIIMDIRIAGYPMGTDTTINMAVNPLIECEAYGTGKISFIEVLRYSGVYFGGHPKFDVIKRVFPEGNTAKFSFTDSTCAGKYVYYMRVKQQKPIFDPWFSNYREVWGWTSPIKINKTTHVVVKDSVTAIQRVFPTPFKECFAVEFFVPIQDFITIDLYDGKMNYIKTIFRGTKSTGIHYVETGSDENYAAGVYYVVLYTNRTKSVKRVVRI